MSKSMAPARAPFEHAAWMALLVTVAVVPLAVSKFPWSDVPLTYAAFMFPQTIALVIGLSVTLVLWAIALLRRETALTLSWRLIPPAAFFTWAAVATVTALEPLRALFGRSSSALSLTGIAALTVLLLLLTQLTGSRQRVLLLTRTVCYSAAAVAVLALLQQLFSIDPFGLPEVETWMLGRGYATLGNPDHLGTFLVLPSVLALGLSLAEDDRLHRLLALGCLGLAMTALVGTLTRGAWIGALLGMLALAVPAWLMTSDRRRVFAAPLVVLLLGAALALMASDAADLRSRFATQPAEPFVSVEADTADTVLSGRPGLWRVALDIAGDRPLVGTGPASFELGWYPRAESATSPDGNVAVGEDPHSLYFTALATTGYPGLLTLLAALGVILALSVRTSASLVRQKRFSPAEVLYVGWTAGSIGLLAALSVGVISTPIAALLFSAFAVLLRPGMRNTSPAWLNRAFAVAGLAAAVALAVTLAAPLAAERALVRAAAGRQSVEAARDAVAAVPWNQDVQAAYCRLRVAELEAMLSRNPSAAADDITAFANQLALAGVEQPLEYLYPSVRADVLTRASELLGPAEFAEDAVAAADDALAIMPASIPVRVQKALALSDLGEYDEMAAALEGYWEFERGSSYPGIVYAQALALSGDVEEAWRVFDLLAQRFPGDTSVEAARQQTQGLLQQP